MAIAWIAFFAFALTHLGKAEINVEYIQGSPRLFLNTSFMDYFFCCNVKGQFLRMEVNRRSLIGFSKFSSDRVVKGAVETFKYFATLVSLGGNEQEGFQYDTVLVVSASSPINIEVVCRSDSDNSSTDNRREPRVRTIPRAFNYSDSINMQQVFAASVVQPSSGGRMTYGLVCGVKLNFQTWSVENEINDFGFNTFNVFGTTQPSLTFNTPGTLDQLAFLNVASEPYDLVSVMFVTGDVNTTVTCTAGPYIISLNTSNMNDQALTEDTSTFLPTSSPEETTSTYVSESETTENHSFQINMVSQGWRNLPTSVVPALALLHFMYMFR